MYNRVRKRYAYQDRSLREAWCDAYLPRMLMSYPKLDLVSTTAKKVGKMIANESIL
jgi:hypothetical protein